MTPARLAFLDALRGFAALWVFAYHIWNYFYPGCNTQTAPYTWPQVTGWVYQVTFVLFQYGYFGVTVFFVLSGFCIHLPQARRAAATGDDGLRLRSFFERRFWRLYPAYFASLFVAALGLGAMRLMAWDWSQPIDSPFAFFLEAFGVDDILINALFLLPFHESSKGFNPVLWTLVFEVQFYLAYPLLLWMMRRIGLVPVALLLLAAELWLVPRPTPVDPTLVQADPWFYFFLSRYFEWYLGVIGAELFARHGRVMGTSKASLGLVAFTCFGALCTLIDPLWPYRDLCVASATFFLIAVLARPEGTGSGDPLRALEGSGNPLQARRPRSVWRESTLRLFAWLGLFSYSLYLLHMPLLRLIVAGNTLLADYFGWSAATAQLLVFDAIPLVILGSYGFYWVFERPFLKPAGPDPRQPRQE